MFGIGMQELLVVLVIAIIVLGPKRLPEVARALGKGVREFRKATSEIKETLDVEGNLKKIEEEVLFDEDDIPKENPPRGRHVTKETSGKTEQQAQASSKEEQNKDNTQSSQKQSEV